MKTKVFLTLIGCFFAVSIWGQPIVPSQENEVQHDFSRRFPNASNIAWTAQPQGNGITAIFNYQGRKCYTRYDSLGKILETQKQVETEELPRLVARSLQNEYPDYAIGTIYYVKLPEKIIYKIVVKKAESSYLLQIYPYGKIYKKSELSAGNI